MGTPDHGLAAVAYGPSEVSTVVADGVPVSIAEKTDYPFGESVTLSVDTPRPVAFPLALRIPGWANGATVSLNGTRLESVKAGEFFRVTQEWKTGDTVELHFPMQVRQSTWYNNLIAVERGPLVFSLKIGESWHKIKQTGPAADWEVYPTTPWNYALIIDNDNLPASFQVTQLPVGHQPFSIDEAPVEIKVKARRLPEWQIVDDSAGPLPTSPATSKQPEETISLIPYGAAKLRITAFPYMEK